MQNNYIYLSKDTQCCRQLRSEPLQRRVDGLKSASMCLWTVSRAQALLRGRAWVAQLWAKSVGAVRLRAVPFFLVQQGCLRFGVSRCGLAAAVVGGGVRCFVGVNLSSSFSHCRVCGGSVIIHIDVFTFIHPHIHTHIHMYIHISA